MGLLQNFIQRKREREGRIREAEQNDQIFHDIERKKLSHNEREVIGVFKREKEKSLTEALRWEEKRRKADEILRERNMFNHGGFNLLE